jgi:eukaryotic-like serine/threonine-protein kinase
MRINPAKTLFTLTLLLLIAADSKPKTDFSKVQVPADFKSYNSTREKFDIKYPPTWRLEEKEEAVFFFSPREGEQDTFLENINLRADPAEGLKITDLPEAFKAEINKQFQNVKFDKFDRATIDGHDAYFTTYTATFQNTNMKWAQLITIARDKVFTLTFTADPTTFEKYWPTAEQTFASVRLNSASTKPAP